MDGWMDGWTDEQKDRWMESKKQNVKLTYPENSVIKKNSS